MTAWLAAFLLRLSQSSMLKLLLLFRPLALLTVPYCDVPLRVTALFASPLSAPVAPRVGEPVQVPV